MYREVLPALDAFCRAEAGLTTFMELFPRFHGAGLVGGDLYLVFEDILSSGGRYVTGKREFHSAEEVVLSLRGLASLHAASYCYQVTTNQRLGRVQYSTAQYSTVQYSTVQYTRTDTRSPPIRGWTPCSRSWVSQSSTQTAWGRWSLSTRQGLCTGDLL